MKRQYVGEIRTGDRINDVFMLAEKNPSTKKDGEAYLSVVLSDKTGTIRGVVWDDVEKISRAASAGDIVEINARVTEFKGKLQLVIEDMEARPAESADPADFIRCTERNIDVMFDRIMKITEGIATDHLRNLLLAFWNDPEFAQKFKTAPAAKKMHHNYLGGLLEHTLSMAVLAEKVGVHYGGIDKDLLIAGAILHDIGKTRELEYDNRIMYSVEGRLLTHIVIGVGMIDEKIATIPDFPKEKANLLKHMVVSHHGTREFGSPEPPMTIEAVLLNYIDEIDAKVNAIREFMTTDGPEPLWTPYHRLLGRYFYKGDNQDG